MKPNRIVDIICDVLGFEPKESYYDNLSDKRGRYIHRIPFFYFPEEDIDVFIESNYDRSDPARVIIIKVILKYNNEEILYESRRIMISYFRQRLLYFVEEMMDEKEKMLDFV